MKFKYFRPARNNFHIDQNSRRMVFHQKHHGSNLKFRLTDSQNSDRVHSVQSS